MCADSVFALKSGVAIGEIRSTDLLGRKDEHIPDIAADEGRYSFLPDAPCIRSTALALDDCVRCFFAVDPVTRQQAAWT